MGNNQPAEVTQKQLDEANAIWVGFTKFAKIGIIATCISLSLLAFFLL